MESTSKPGQPTTASGVRDRVSYRRLLRFFGPLAVTPFLISSTHNIINAALARLPAPELTIAVFTVVKSFTNAIKAPVLISGQVTTAIVDGRRSYALTTGFLWSTAGFFFAVLIVLGYTSLGGLFLRAVMGLSDPATIELGYRAMRITAFLPLAEVLRDSNRGLLIARQRTASVSGGTLVRLVLITGFVVWAVSSGTLPGMEVASVAWVGGIAIEGLMVFGALFLLFGSPVRAADGILRDRTARNGDVPKNRREPTIGSILKFFLPLAVMMIVRGALQPVLQAGIARGAESATRALAVYGVTWALVFNVMSPLDLLQNVSLVFASGRDDPSWPRVLRFSAALGASMTGILLLIGLTPLGYVVFEGVLGVSDGIAREASDAVLAFSLLPLFWSVREAYWGLMLRSHRTHGIGIGKAVNLVVVAVSMLLLFGPVRTLVVIPSAVVGAIALSAGELAETVLVARLAARLAAGSRGRRTRTDQP